MRTPRARQATMIVSCTITLVAIGVTPVAQSLTPNPLSDSTQDWHVSFDSNAGTVMRVREDYQSATYGQASRHMLLDPNGIGKPFTVNFPDSMPKTSVTSLEPTCLAGNLSVLFGLYKARHLQYVWWFDLATLTHGEAQIPEARKIVSASPTGWIEQRADDTFVDVEAKTGTQRILGKVDNDHPAPSQFDPRRPYVNHRYRCTQDGFVGQIDLIDNWTNPLMSYGSWAGKRTTVSFPKDKKWEISQVFDSFGERTLLEVSKNGDPQLILIKGTQLTELTQTTDPKVRGAALTPQGVYYTAQKSSKDPHQFWYVADGGKTELIAPPKDMTVIDIWRAANSYRAELQVKGGKYTASFDPTNRTFGPLIALPPGEFNDLQRDSQGNSNPQRDAVMWLTDRWLTDWENLDAFETFSPDNPMTRASTTGWLYRHYLAGTGKTATPPAGSPGPVITPDAETKAWVAKLGLGFEDPAQQGTSVTRGQIAAALYAYAGSPAFKPPAQGAHPDVKPDHPYYKQICWAEQQGITTPHTPPGFKTAPYRPNDAMSRGEFAEFLYRYSINYQHQKP